MNTSTPHGPGTPPPGSPPQSPPPGASSGPSPEPTPGGVSGGDAFFDRVRQTGLVRSDERWVGGVAGGLAIRLGVDPLVTRGAFVVVSLLSGVGLVLYGLAWALLPEERDGRIHVQELGRGNFDIAFVGALVTFALGLSGPQWWSPLQWTTWGWWGDWTSSILWIAGIAAVVVLVTGQLRSGGGQGTGPTTSLPRTDAPSPSSPSTPSSPRPGGPTMTAYPPPPVATGAGSAAAQPTAAQPAYGPRPHDGGPATPAGPRVPPPPPAPPRPRGPGAVATAVVVALTLLTLAGLMYADRVGGFDGPVLLTAASVGVVLCGIGIVVAGVLGRTSGGLGGLGVLGIVLVVPLLALNQVPWGWATGGTALGDVVETPRTVSEAEQGYSVGAGQARIDLTEVPLDEGSVEVPVSVGAGDAYLVLPEDADTVVEAQVFAGEIQTESGRFTRGGVGRTATIESDSVAAGADPDLVVRVTVAAGQVTVIEE